MKSLIISNIEVLLNYCMRFYERQFITREDVNHDPLGVTESDAVLFIAQTQKYNELKEKYPLFIT